MRDDPGGVIETSVVGRSDRHDSAPGHVTGRARYIDDIPEPPGVLHIAFGLADRARAKILSMDLEAVRAAPGVVGVYTAEDVPFANDVSPLKHDEPMFATGEVLYDGQVLFAVAAESRLAARKAARLARVEYQDLEPILTIEQALAAESYLEPPYQMGRGDVEAALAAAPRTLSGRIEIGGQEHLYLEGQAALAVPGEAGEMTVHSSTQHPTEIQHKVAETLGVPFAAVTVEVRRMGGGFGGKESQGNLPACAASFVAMKTGRPAKVVLDRDDDMRVTGKRHDFRIDYRVGFDDEGRLLALDVDQSVRCGFSWDLSEPIADRAMFHAENAYYVPAARIVSRRLRTNTCSNTAFRGFGGPQGMVAAERVLDEVAFALGKDPLAVRRLNYYAPAEAKGDPRRITPYGMEVEDCVIEAMTAELVESADYDARRAEIASWNAQSPVLKRGIAFTPVKFGISFTKSFLNQAGALVHVYTDGSIHLSHGGTEMGQGLYVKVAQVTAEVFGVPLERVKINATSTGKVPNTSPTAASSGADMNGMAAKHAAETIRDRMAAHLAQAGGVDATDVVFADGQVRIGARETISFGEAAHRCWFARVSLSSTGYYATPKVGWDKDSASGRPFFYFAYGAAVVEAAIDRLTGENRLLRVDILHETGRSLNPAIDLGQIEGGFAQGAGWLTMEELVWDAKGRLRTHAPSTYKIPCASDRAPDMRIRLWEKGWNREATVYRSKAVGEPPLMLGIGALMALSDAVAACGDGGVYPALDAPATPERVLAAVQRVEAGRAP